jgi:hypothetical protein
VLGRKDTSTSQASLQKDCKREGLDLAVEWSDLKTVLIPRQHVLKALDPDGTSTAQELQERILQLAKLCKQDVLKDSLAADKAGASRRYWGVYHNFHMLHLTQD